ncbi:MAG TPA: hypothetical protein VGX24_06390 [Pyrinomonadaceae bacterium]|jgi:hypothetical protein|nr:hypothetical protein [Pyrinomonadaceae bacterium]
MRKTAFIILGLSAAVTLFSPIIWLVGLLGGIGGSLIHLFLLLTPFGILGLIVGAIMLLVGRRAD